MSCRKGNQSLCVCVFLFFLGNWASNGFRPHVAVGKRLVLTLVLGRGWCELGGKWHQGLWVCHKTGTLKTGPLFGSLQTNPLKTHPKVCDD